MDDIINGPLYNNCASLSPDGTVFFYAYEGDIYWLNADILQEYR
ncbi:MAG: PD40 domain-containing protein [Bacteroidetes bacterium]|nr:PD40 domain-containing protein [Bacteroidota bacterium]